MALSIWSGNVKVFPLSEEQEQTQKTDQELGDQKFNSCVHRQGPVTEKIRTCCTSRDETGYRCSHEKINVFPLKSTRCCGCPHHEIKS